VKEQLRFLFSAITTPHYMSGLELKRRKQKAFTLNLNKAECYGGQKGGEEVLCDKKVANAL
jgi:hypothetical protein